MNKSAWSDPPRIAGAVLPLAAVALLAIAAAPLGAQAPHYEKVVSFTDASEDIPDGGENRGADVTSLLEGPDGLLYGTTRYLQGSGIYGGGSGPGTIFRLDPDNGLTTLTIFAETPGDLRGSRGTLELLAVDGRFYGLTEDGGAAGLGSVFRISQSGAFATVAAFTGSHGATPGSKPVLLFQAADRNFYGATAEGGAHNAGTIFRMSAAGAVTTLAEFSGESGATPGRNPNKLLLAADGHLYGTTTQGGASNAGTVFKLSITGAYELLAQFTGTGGARPGGSPNALIEASPGVLVGTTTAGGAADLGTLFRIAPDLAWRTIEFDGSNGSLPQHDLVKDDSGNVYGVTWRGGAANNGVVYQLDSGGAFVPMHQYTGYTELFRHRRKGPLLMGRTGILYGSIFRDPTDGIGSAGTVFELQINGEYREISDFRFQDGIWAGFQAEYTDGFDPENLLQAADGTLCGSTIGGISGLLGAHAAVFRIQTDTGQRETLVAFGVPDRPVVPRQPWSGLVQSANGWLHATSAYGGENDLGSVFAVSPAGGMKVVHSFSGNAWILGVPAVGGRYGEDGLHPRGGLRLDEAGCMYGTTSFVDWHITTHIPVIFKLSPAGELLWRREMPLPWTAFQDYLGIARGVPADLGGGRFLIPAGDDSGTLLEFTSEGELSVWEARLPAGPLLAADGWVFATAESVGVYYEGAIFRAKAGEESSSVLASLNDYSFMWIQDEWRNAGIGRQTGVFQVPFKVAVDYGTDCVVGLSVGRADAHAALACAIKWSPSGQFEVLDNGVFTAAGFSADQQSEVQVVFHVDLPASRYTVTIDGVPLAMDLSIAGGQNALAFLDHFGGIATSGRVRISDLNRIGVRQGYGPRAALIRGSDGNYYGSAFRGGAHGHGTVFRVTPEGVLTKLIDFTGAAGAAMGSGPVGALVEHDGWFYGTTSAGGAADVGTVFRMTAAGAFESLFDFAADERDSKPMGDLMVGSDGNIYGTTSGNPDADGKGSVFRLVLDGPPTIYPMEAELTAANAAFVHAKVNARGASTAVWLDYGLDGVNFQSLPVTGSISGFSTVELGAPLANLARGVTYFYRFRAIRGAEAVVSQIQSFETIGRPTVLAGDAADVRPATARLTGTVRAGNAATQVTFEYGTDGNTFPFAVAATPAFVTGSNEIEVGALVGGLAGGTTYHFRLVGSNVEGTTVSGVRTFVTPAQPAAVTGGVEPLSTTRVRVEGTVDPKGSTARVVFEYREQGTGGTPPSQPAVPDTVAGVGAQPVSAVLRNLDQGKTYQYRVVATADDLPPGAGEWREFTLRILSGLTQLLPEPPPAATGSLVLQFNPPDLGAWRFLGEAAWRRSGEAAGVLAAGPRTIEFLSVPGFTAPPRESVEIGGSLRLTLNRSYTPAGTAGSGGIAVSLRPAELAAAHRPDAQRARWRLSGESGWRESGTTAAGLPAGVYQVECAALEGSDHLPPPPVTLALGGGAAQAITLDYTRRADGLAPVPFDELVGGEDPPYAHLGQVRGRAGSGTGFAVKRRVVVTAGHAVFDDRTMSYVPQVEWLHQRHAGTREPVPLTARGYLLLAGYAAQRRAEGTPGTSSPLSHNLDCAVLYFQQEVARGGFSGFLASEAGDENEFLASSAGKLLAGYPVAGVPADRLGILHASPLFTAPLQPAFGETWTTTAVLGAPGCSGGPLFVRHPNGTFYPAAVYLGGSGQSVVRAIDGALVDLIARADSLANGGDNGTGGGLHYTDQFTEDSLETGGVHLLIEPARARDRAGWRLHGPAGPLVTLGHDHTLEGLEPGLYVVEMTGPDEFLPPDPVQIEVSPGVTHTFTYTFVEAAAPSELAVWRTSHFGDPSDTGPGADDADPDGDGSNNITEFHAGTDPNNPAPEEGLRACPAPAPAGSFAVKIHAKPDRLYQLERSTGPAGAPWLAVASAGPLDDSQALILTDDDPPAPRAFYRVKVLKP